MNSYSASDATGSGSGWNITVAGNAPAGSAVFKEYCPGGACGSAGYVTSGLTLPANSLTINSTSGSIAAQNGSTGSGPTHQCNSGCFVDAGSASKLLSAASGNGMGTWQAGYAANALSLATPSTLKALPNNEVYQVNLLWTLNSGP